MPKEINYNCNLDHRYEKGKIYKLILPNDYFYIGATRNEIRYRIGTHKNDYNKNNDNKLYKHIRETLNGDWKSIKYEVIEYYPCGSKRYLESRESYHIRNNIHDEKCLNTVASFTPEEETIKRKDEYASEYRGEHRDKISEYACEYRKNNKERLLEEAKEYYLKHKGDRLEYRKKYYKENIEKIEAHRKEYAKLNKEKIREKKKLYYEKSKEKIMEKITCECGSIIARCERTRHERTKKHTNFVNSKLL